MIETAFSKKSVRFAKILFPDKTPKRKNREKRGVEWLQAPQSIDRACPAPLHVGFLALRRHPRTKTERHFAAGSKQSCPFCNSLDWIISECLKIFGALSKTWFISVNQGPSSAFSPLSRIPGRMVLSTSVGFMVSHVLISRIKEGKRHDSLIESVLSVQ